MQRRATPGASGGGSVGPSVSIRSTRSGRPPFVGTLSDSLSKAKDGIRRAEDATDRDAPRPRGLACDRHEIWSGQMAGLSTIPFHHVAGGDRFEAGGVAQIANDGAEVHQRSVDLGARAPLLDAGGTPAGP